ncbi:MAG: phosphate transporter [Spirochaetes bacterium]|nr:MAG: phosphate transporter [Spirochaetota bacterium]
MVSLSSLVNSKESYVAYNAAAALRLERAGRLRDTMLADPRIIGLARSLGDWPGPVIASRKSSRQHFHILAFLAEIGLKPENLGMGSVVAAILRSMDVSAMPTLPSSQGIGGWAFCDAPNTLYGLARMGVKDPRIAQGMDFIASKVRHSGGGGGGGCGCEVSPSFGAWRGPGRAADPCPYATMIVLRLLSLEPDRYESQIRSCAAAIQNLWARSRDFHPYIFYMGEDFRKLKLPSSWYDILSVADALSRHSAGIEEPGFGEMLALILSKETDSGFVPESNYRPWKEFDIGQNKKPSDGMSLRVRIIQARAEGHVS